MRIFSETATTDFNKMLYCPKCQQTYEEETGRFCPNDNARLMPADNSANQTGGVFTNVLKRTTEEGDKFPTVPKFSQIAFQLPPTSRIFKPEPEVELELDPQPPVKIFKSDSELDLPIGKTAEPQFELDLELDSPAETAAPPEAESPPEIAPSIETEPPTEIVAEPETEIESPAEISPRLVESEEVPMGRAQFDDLKTNPAGREPLTWNSAAAFVGETVNNRYTVVEHIGQDESALIYLAEDEIATQKKAVVRVLMDEDADDLLGSKIYGEERVALANVVHPNIAAVIDSGELSEGKPFIVTEFVEGETVREHLEKAGQFNARRTARIIRQASNALSEVHQGGILHRNLKPENIVLTIDESGAEQIKLTNFGASKGKLNEENLLYKSPEQVEGKPANPMSDEYALAVIAYQMLTGRLPFNAASVGDLLRAQREGLKLSAADLRDDPTAPTDAVLKRALSFNPFDRYPKTRDFGDEFYNAIIAEDAPDEIETAAIAEDEKPDSAPTENAPETLAAETAAETSLAAAAVSVHALTAEKTDAAKPTENLWEKRSPEMPNEPTARRNLFSILGVAAILAALLVVWYYFINRPAQTFVNNAPVETAGQNQPTIQTPPVVEPSQTAAPTPVEIEIPPLPRAVRQPPETEFFQNSKANLNGDLAKNFLGFSLYYPKSWKRSNAPKNYLDISKINAAGLPVEQMLVTYYNSKGTFKDDAEIFPVEVKKTNQDLKKILPNYRMISEGKKTVNNGWQTYEVEFQGTGKTATGEAITIWGKRLFIPTAIRGTKNGYVVTMLATSLSESVKSVADVGIKGELAAILETFEPNQNF